jgi:hypothetical protein
MGKVFSYFKRALAPDEKGMRVFTGWVDPSGEPGDRLQQRQVAWREQAPQSGRRHRKIRVAEIRAS